MATDFATTSHAFSAPDPLLPWLRSIKMALNSKSNLADLDRLLLTCVTTFKHNSQYHNDPRFLKIWLLHLEARDDFENVFKELEESKIWGDQSLLYELYAALLEAKENWEQAHMVYQIGILREAKPLERLKRAQYLFLDRVSCRFNACSLQKINAPESFDLGSDCVNPWSPCTMNELLNKIHHKIVKYDGYHSNNKAYSGELSLSSLRNSSRKKIVKIGGKKYQIKGCAGQGGFAQVFKAYVDSNPDDIVAMKIQKPPFPWEFYMYRQLDDRISDNERSHFGFAHRIHLYSDYSILVCDYLSNGTLQDAINSYKVTGKPMEEVLCMYYTIEMLCMLETLHGVGIIHGDFKPDNLLVRYPKDDLTEDGFRERSGPWSDQGLCLVDWGKGIDLQLFPDNIEFTGDCRTSGFRCAEMQEKRQWKFQVDTYGLCVIVHMMLHNSYMEIEKNVTSDGGYIYRPKAPFKRYWNELWKKLFTQLLNGSPGNDKQKLQNLRECFQDHLCSDPKLFKKLKDMLTKQRLSLCST